MRKVFVIIAVLIFLISCGGKEEGSQDWNFSKPIYEKYRGIISATELGEMLGYSDLIIKEVIKNEDYEGITIKYSTANKEIEVLQIDIGQRIQDYYKWLKFMEAIKTRELGAEERLVGGLGDYACYFRQDNGYNSLKFVVSANMLEILISGTYGGYFNSPVPVSKRELLKVGRLIERRL